MTDSELIDLLSQRQALIVHCSRPGKANTGVGGLLFPGDLLNAAEICAKQHKELSCSVVWPTHVKTFGAVGIVLRPRSTRSITSVSPRDSGTSYDPQTGKRHGGGAPFSGAAVHDTFTSASDYNEWTVTDADTVGIFINPCEPLQVAKVIDVTKVPGYDPAMEPGDLVAAQDISIRDIMAAFPHMPVYSYCGKVLMRIIDAAGIYA
ncbi:MAG TPA: hypothetical protein VGR92_15360 [Steroidobacteraceae bacterium]|nr:hypothetical protein [Steroidobacteraceae bacterium]